MRVRHRNGGLRKVCDCPRRKWAKCPHGWHFNYKVKGGPHYRFSLDAELGRHVAGKTEAELALVPIRAAILAGTFKRRHEVASVPDTSAPATADAITLATFTRIYLERRGKTPTSNEVAHLRRLTAFALGEAGSLHALGDKPLGAITEDDFEAFFGQLRRDGRAAATLNKYRLCVAAMLRWAVKKGYLARNPIEESETIKYESEKGARRSRRLETDVLAEDGTIERPGEERRLLAAAGPPLQRLIIAAIESGMRRGELLSLVWRDVDLRRRELKIRAETSKSGKMRILPISARLAGVLEMARFDPAGREFGPLDFVFGDEVGRKIANTKRSWETCVLKAHGYAPVWEPGGKLSAASRAQLRSIDLHFHDLRHEAGSRLVEAGWPVHHVQEMLGHADLKQTTTYLNVTRLGLQESMRRFTDDSGRRCKPVANEADTEHRPACNDDSPAIGKSVVN